MTAAKRISLGLFLAVVGVVSVKVGHAVEPAWGLVPAVGVGAGVAVLAGMLAAVAEAFGGGE